MKRAEIRTLAAERLISLHENYTAAETAKILAEMLRSNKVVLEELEKRNANPD